MKFIKMFIIYNGKLEELLIMAIMGGSPLDETVNENMTRSEQKMFLLRY
jgi:hypothetical protein